ncbi:MAG: saccharopine dehydrogenase NADP-binding domain-containing protein [Blastocatellia bacterium]|nr:saccharopine dehydrogenase NADP-binding domain-containing protein [Blastocatellia bacterium]
MKKLLIIGATGVIGQRIVKLSERLLTNTEIIKACRKIPKQDSSFRQVDIFNQESLERVLVDINVVINSVGPFEYNPELLLNTCFKANCHYIDIAETKDFISQVENIALSNKNSSYVVTGCSTIPALIETIVQSWKEEKNLAEIRVFLSMGSNNNVSPTLIYSLLRPLGKLDKNNRKYFAQLIKKFFPQAGKRLYGNYPSAFEQIGVKINNQFLEANFYVGFDKPIYSYLLFLASKILPKIPDNLLFNLSKIADLFTPIVKSIGSQTGILLIETLDKNQNILDTIEILANSEGLNIPALPSVWTAKKLLENNLNFPNKTLLLSDLFSPKEIFQLLNKEGYKIYGAN